MMRRPYLPAWLVCSLCGAVLSLTAGCSSSSSNSDGKGGAAAGGAAAGGAAAGGALGAVGGAGLGNSGAAGAVGSSGAANGGSSAAAGNTGSGAGPSAGAGGSSSAGAGGGSIAGAGGSAGAAGNAGTAGSAGAAGSEAMDFGIAGPSRCATAGVALCEDFENGLDPGRWSSTMSGDASLAVDTQHVARGAKSLHVKTSAGNGHAYITEKMTFPAMNNVLYGRMFVFLGDALTTNGHFSLAEGDGTGNGAGIRFGGQNKFFGVGTDGGASGDWTDKDNQLIPAQTWMCMEFELKGDTNEFHVSWDDVERTALNRGVKQHAGFVMPQFTSLWFGYWMYNMTEPQELWIDELAVDFKPIGCTK